ncbi:glutamine amidotransferase [Rhodococcus sp. Leaf7]|nr:glutamine amidotransferase [Rhodococcus sp. Leaf7]KQU43465.1 glutamine amidotransferase [Rhodococcus sp. Leaf247]
MGTYGDSGNALVLRQRMLMRGLDAEIVSITLADPVPDSLDVYVLGGAEDSAQRLATKHLARYPGLQRAAERGAPVLAICAAIQVLGEWYETSSGERVDGVSMLNVTTAPQETRSIGEVITRPVSDRLTQTLTGFENHRGGTTLGPDAAPFARVEHGVGNGVGDGNEGVVQGSVIGTYMHGPALARNPELADHLLETALGHSLEPLHLADVEQLRTERLRR